MRRLTAGALALVPLAAVALILACSGPALPPTRGYIVISLDALGAGSLGSYGYERDTSPFLDDLANRGALFERAVVQYTSTLKSHMSLFTGLYPQQHGVNNKSPVLSEEIPLFPELFQQAGFRTGGFTEGGWMEGFYGFKRGFDTFRATRYQKDEDVVRTLEQGLEFLRGLEDGEPFLLFLHTYSIHDPYTPPDPYPTQFWRGEPPAGPPPTGPVLNEVNQGERELTAEQIAYFKALYDGSIRYVDAQLEWFFGEVGALGLLEDTTIVITSDHGEEFFEHGKMAHQQVYPELVFVPLIVMHPGIVPPLRVPSLVQSIDLAPTLLELARIEPPKDLPGVSLVPYLTGGTLRLADQAYSEVDGRISQRTLLADVRGTTYQFLWSRPDTYEGRNWVSRTVTFETAQPVLEFQAISYGTKRPIQVTVDGQPHSEFELAADWQPVRLDLAAGEGRRLVTLSTPGCEAPPELDRSGRNRCLSFKVDGLPLYRTELFDLDADPGALLDLGEEEAEVRRLLARRLQNLRWEPLAPPEDFEIPPETEETLKALGYLN